MPYTPSAIRNGKIISPYNGEWRRLRSLKLRQEPLCRLCLSVGRTVPATVVDHILPISDGGTNTTENLQPLCKRCHDSIKTPSDVLCRKASDNSRIILVAVWLGEPTSQPFMGVDYRRIRREFQKKTTFKKAHQFMLASLEGLLHARKLGVLPPCEITVICDDAMWMAEASKRYGIQLIVSLPADTVGNEQVDQEESDYLRERFSLEYIQRLEHFT